MKFGKLFPPSVSRWPLSVFFLRQSRCKWKEFTATLPSAMSSSKTGQGRSLRSFVFGLIYDRLRGRRCCPPPCVLPSCSAGRRKTHYPNYSASFGPNCNENKALMPAMPAREPYWMGLALPTLHSNSVNHRVVEVVVQGKGPAIRQRRRAARSRKKTDGLPPQPCAFL